MPDRPPDVPVARLGDADRDRLTVVLREHYALGRLDIDEFARRVGIVLAADYADEAAAAVRDLPPIGAIPGAGAAPGPGRAPARRDGGTGKPPRQAPAGCRPRSDSAIRPRAR